MELSKQPDFKEEEIDLYALWQVLFRKKYFLLGSILFFASLAFVVSLRMPNVYKSEVVFRLGSEFKLENSRIQQAPLILNRFTSPIEANEFVDVFSKKFSKQNLEKTLPNNHKLVEGIKIINIKDSQNKVRFIIESKDPKAFYSILSEIIGYLETSPVFKNFLEQEREILLQQIKDLEKAIESAKEFENYYSKFLRQGKLTLIGISPAEFEKKIVEMETEKNRAKQALSNLKAVEVLEQTTSDKPVKPNILMNVAIGAIAGLLISTFLVLFLDSLKRRKVNIN